MPYDEASFDATQVQAVYPPGLQQCFLGSVSTHYERHHILGRRPPRGYSRDVMSSILNLAWLGHDVHAGPERDDYRMRDLLLEKAFKHVNLAVIKKAYTYTETDLEFMRLASEWQQKTFSHYSKKS